MSLHVPTPMLRKLTDRDGHTCIMTSTDTDRLVPQHRQGGMGGRRNKHRLPNLVWLDSILNGLITSDADLQAIAKAWGVAISLHADAEEIPVFIQHEHAWFLLRGEGRDRITGMEALDRMHDFYGDDYFAWKAIADASPNLRVLELRGVAR